MHDAEVVEHGHERGEEDDRGQHVEGEEAAGLRDEPWRLRDRRVPQRLARSDRDVVPDEVAEDEACAFDREAQQRDDHGVECGEDPLAHGCAQDEHCEGELESNAPQDHAPGDRAAVHAEQPRDPQKREEPDGGDEAAVPRRRDLGAGSADRFGSGRRGLWRVGAGGDRDAVAGLRGLLRALLRACGEGAGTEQQHGKAPQQEYGARGHGPHHPAPGGGEVNGVSRRSRAWAPCTRGAAPPPRWAAPGGRSSSRARSRWTCRCGSRPRRSCATRPRTCARRPTP